MNNSIRKPIRVAGILAIAMSASMLLASCASAPTNPAGSADARSKLDLLQANPSLANLAPVEIREAEASVRIAEQPVGKDVALGDYRVYMADRKVEIAMAKASTRYAEAQRPGLSQARDDARLAARTAEADKARQRATMAQRRADEAQRETDAARANASETAANSARDAAEATRTAEELQKQIDALKAEATDRGLVLTLGNTLFATGRSELKQGGSASLDKLVVFLNEYSDRNVAIEGHTDDVGSLEMNQTLSQHRADSVRSYLMQKGIQSERITAEGMGETQPVADNLSESGRQQNRRVEVIIKNPLSAVPSASIN